MPEWPVPRRECRASGFKPMGKLVNRGGALVKVLARERREEAWEEVAGEQGDAVGEGAVSVGVMDGDWAPSPSWGAAGEVGGGVSAHTTLAEGAPERGCGGAGGRSAQTVHHASGISEMCRGSRAQPSWRIAGA